MKYYRPTSSGGATDHAYVRFVLNGCELGDQRIEAVLHSYRSARSFTGDHTDAHAIRLTQVSLSELKLYSPNPSNFGRGWIKGSAADDALREAIRLAGRFCEFPWLPTTEQVLSDDFYVWPMRIYLSGLRPTATELIFLRLSDRMLFYIDLKT